MPHTTLPTSFIACQSDLSEFSDICMCGHGPWTGVPPIPLHVIIRMEVALLLTKNRVEEDGAGGREGV